VERAHRAPLAEHLQGDALLEVGEAAPVGDERLDGPAQHVDEARRDGEAAGVDLACGGDAGEVAHGDDAVAADADVPDARRAAAAVVDGAAAEDDVEALARGWAGGPAGACERQDRQGREGGNDARAAARHGDLRSGWRGTLALRAGET